MSPRHATIIVCDGIGPDGNGCDCSHPMDSFPEDTARSIRRELRQDGWKVSLPGGRDLCPDCMVCLE